MRRGVVGLILVMGVSACGKPQTQRKAAETAPEVTFVLALQSNGPGVVVGNGTDCRGRCTIAVAPGTQVHLEPTPDQNAGFDGWQGACSGKAACDVVLSNDAEVSASFSLREDALADCHGVVPPSLGTSVSRTVPGGGTQGSFCDAVTSDREGNVAGHLDDMFGNPWTVWTADGAWLGQLHGWDLVPQESGFQGISYDETTSEMGLYAWAANGAVVRKTVETLNGSSSFPALTGGSTTVEITCATQGAAKTELIVSRFDEAGVLVSAAKFEGIGCGLRVEALGDELDHTLVVVADSEGALGFGASRLVARWLERAGNALTDWFDVGSESGADFRLSPLIGGGAALGNSSHWLGVIPSGEERLGPVPAFLLDGTELRIVRDGKAYARLPSHNGSLDLFSSAGNACGAVQFPTDTVVWELGADGTAISMSGPDGCTLTWWPHLLK